MPYGLNIVVSKWTVQNDLYDVMEQETIDAGELATLAAKSNVRILSCRRRRPWSGSWKTWSMKSSGRMHGYVILQDATVDLYYFMK